MWWGCLWSAWGDTPAETWSVIPHTECRTVRRWRFVLRALGESRCVGCRSLQSDVCRVLFLRKQEPFQSGGACPLWRIMQLGPCTYTSRTATADLEFGPRQSAGLQPHCLSDAHESIQWYEGSENFAQGMGMCTGAYGTSASAPAETLPEKRSHARIIQSLCL